TDLAASFTGEQGHAYRFRARAWQRYPNGAHLFSPYREQGDTRTVVGGSAELRGLVLTNQGRPLMGATVAISGTGFSGSTDPQGRVSLSLGLLPGPQTVTVERAGWLAPSPVYSVTFGLTATVPLTWTMRSPDDVVVNGEFEAGLDGWSWAADAPEVVTAPVHTGRGALALAAPAAVSVPVTTTAAVSQTVVVTDAWEPVLSFWYLPEGVGEGDRLNVVLTIVTETVTATWPITATTAPLTATEPITSVVPVTTTLVLTPTLDGSGWSHFWCYAGLPRAALTGTITLEFHTRNEGVGAPFMVYLDEVSLGARAGGRYAVYLPVVGRGW
ncbi:MAG TPA: carboxypeptidase-like regulatory domain-containing protein, partial [Anaerolineae bacterium]|nr:carboxypeptidase-like regulatory domain-containing protein [Anaerolineae bacterium]